MLAATGDQALTRERLPAISVLIGLFIVGAVSLTTVWAFPVKLTGVVLAVGYAIMAWRARIYPAPEVLLYLAWVTWCLTGLVGVRSTILFTETWLTVFQIWVLIGIISTYTMTRKSLSFTLGSLLVGALIVGVYSYWTGEYARVEAVAGGRVSGLIREPNAFARLMVLATMAMAYFWMLPSRRPGLKYLVVGAGMAGAAIACVFSASRTGLVGLMVFYPLWIWFCYRKEMLSRPAILVVVVVAFLLGACLFMVLLARTSAGERLMNIWEVLHGGRRRTVDIRIQLLAQAWALVQEYPLTGVGLGNFRAYWATRLVAHSDYAEVASCTGAPGFVLYFSIFIVLWLRAGRIARHSYDDVARGVARLIRAIVVVVLIMNVGTLTYYNKAAWIAFAAFIGYTSAVWRNLRVGLTQPRGAALPGGVLPVSLNQPPEVTARAAGPAGTG
jgi:O-antigen ligase